MVVRLFKRMLLSEHIQLLLLSWLLHTHCILDLIIQFVFRVILKVCDTVSTKPESPHNTFPGQIPVGFRMEHLYQATIMPLRITGNYLQYET